MAAGGEPIVIIGAGVAGASAAEALRARGFAGDVIVIGEEADEPYDRPPLSKEFLKHGDPAKIRLRKPEFWQEKQIDLRANTRVAAIDGAGHKVALSDGAALAYSKLLIATGSSPRRLPALEQGAPIPIFYLRTLADAKAIRAHLKPGARVGLVGGGVIGLELAATARDLGAEPVVLEAADGLMGRAAPRIIADYLLRFHRARGVDIRLQARITGFDNKGRLALADGTAFAFDLLVIGIGIVVNDQLAAPAGIAAQDGILVDAAGRTNVLDVFAAGDVSRQPHPLTGKLERVENWANAVNQATCIAQNLCDATAPALYRDAPWYWSDQFDLKLQCVGLTRAGAEIVRGNVESGSFVVFQLEGDRLVGGATVNANREMAALRRLVQGQAVVDPAALADPGVSLKSLAPRQRELT